MAEKEKSIHQLVISSMNNCLAGLEYSKTCDRNVEQLKNRYEFIITNLTQAIVAISGEVDLLKKEIESLKKDNLKLNNKEK